MFDDIILYHGTGHEISKPCYFMPVYTNTSLEKSPMLTTRIEFQGSVWQLGDCFLYIEKDCAGKWMSESWRANDIAQCTEQKERDQWGS